MQPAENPRGDSDGARSNISEATNPSLIGEQDRDGANSSAQHSKTASQVSNSWKDSKFAFPGTGSAMHSKNTSRSSTTKFNVEAKEFKFNPAAAFSPGSGSFSSSFSFSPAISPPGPTSVPRSGQPSIDGISSFNVSAPVFKPDAPVFKPDAPAFKPDVPAFKPEAPAFKPDAPAFKPAVDAPVFKPAATAPVFNPSVNAPAFTPVAISNTTMPSSGFEFFSKGISFKPDAPAFNPSVPTFNPAASAPAPTKLSSKIFGEVNISASDIVKPAKRSKAVPIIRPDVRQQTPEKEPEDHEDESGRITQAEGREKRMRRGGPDGDEVPKFATQPFRPAQPLGESKQPQAAKQDPQMERESVPEDKENLSPNIERAASKSKSPDPLALQPTASIESDLPTPRAEPSAGSRSGTPIDDGTPQESDAATPTVENAPKPFTKKHKSSLSATAKPFEFRPQFGTSGYDFGVHVTKPSVTQNEDFHDGHGSSLRHVSRSPANTYRPSDDGSYKTALGHATYPESESVDFDHLGQASFNDIDAVMKHMNEGGSDFGVERDENSWDQSSARLSPHDFERNDLPPNSNMRSDAPSPSPRRLYATRNMRASSTSITQNPFDDERGGLAYESPVHRLNNADEVPMSDWDEGLLSEGEDKIQTRSRFFDSHVDDLIGRLLQNRLDPLERNLQGIQESMEMMFQRSGRGRRSMSTGGRLDSDADDEDDDIGADSHYRNRSPRKDRKLEKMRSIIREALEAYQPPVTSLPVPVPVPEPVLPEKIRDIVVDALAAHQPLAPPEPRTPENIRDVIMEALAHHQPQWTPPKFEPVPADQIRAIVEEAIVSHKQPMPEPPAEPMKPDEIRSIIAEALITHTPVPVSEPVQPDAIRSIVMEALATHVPPPAPAVEPVQPDMIRSIVAEALASHKPAAALEAPIDIPQPQVDMSEIYQVIGSLKASIAQTTSHHLQADDIREVIDDALRRQSEEAVQREEDQALQEKDSRIAELEAMLQAATLQIQNEAETRSVLEIREIDGARLLKVTEEELGLLREAATDDENKLKALQDKCEDTLRHLDAAHASEDGLRRQLAALQAENEEVKLKVIASESSEGDIKRKLDAVTAENEALMFTLQEHRLSSDKWRNEIQQAQEESEKLRKTIEHSKIQAEEATRVRETMRAKFDKLQQDMVVASGQIASERAQWQKTDEDHMKKYEVLSARIEAEGRTRERLERELERLETQEREGMKLRVILEQSQNHNVKLEETIDQLKKQSAEHQRAAERYEREFREAREAGHVEIRRTRVLMEADIDAANNQVNIVRADLESEISRVRAELDNVRMDTDTLKEKHELDLEAAADAKKNAVAEALASKQLALQEQQNAFERRLELLAQEHTRALDIAREDKERADAFNKDRLALADSKVELVQDKVSLLEEKLAIAKEAASAAAAAAQSVKSPAPASTSYGSGTAGKISPQALRESISVLQEQLQERESRIESLEQQLAEADSDAPAKLKERDTEIGWLRELLGVRVDDLNDLINALAQPSFDRENVRDAAIRIRTNLQMEQQEKERLMSGGQSFPTLATLSNFASPKAVQLAAAFGNWRSKGRESASSALAGNSSNNNSRNHTPSRGAASAQSFLSGLMTPPTSNLRRTPDLPSSGIRPHNLRSNSTSSRGSVGFPSLGKQTVPSTPPLLRKASYDQDAEVEQFSESGFYDDESTIDGEMTPIALHFGQELRR